MLCAGCDMKCFSNRYEITRYQAAATTTQQHPIPHYTPHIALSIIEKENIMKWNSISSIMFCFSLNGRAEVLIMSVQTLCWSLTDVNKSKLLCSHKSLDIRLKFSLCNMVRGGEWGGNSWSPISGSSG